MNEYRIARRVMMAEVSGGTGTRETEVRLDGWCEGGLRQQRNDGRGCATMRERPERVESPGAGFRKISTNSHLYVIGFHHDGCSYNYCSILH